jgi:hypothetical protein
MKCMVEENKKDSANGSITFLYTLGVGACPKVGRLMDCVTFRFVATVLVMTHTFHLSSFTFSMNSPLVST